ncbi:MAG: phosphotransferase, partial [Candidatus Paceibacterota bacterium]
MKTDPKIEELISRYSFKAPVTVLSSTIGIDNDIYFLSDGEGRRYVLRKAKRVEKKDAGFEARLISVLMAEGYKTPRLIPLVDGSLYTETASGWPVFVFDFIEGEQFEAGDVTLELAEKGARALGIFHDICARHLGEIGVNGDRDIFTEIDRLLSVPKGKLQNVARYGEFLALLESYRREARVRMKQGLGGVTVVHNDCGPQNLVFARSEPWMIDLDWSCIGPSMKDVGQM